MMTLQGVTPTDNLTLGLSIVTTVLVAPQGTLRITFADHNPRFRQPHVLTLICMSNFPHLAYVLV
jgi:hypothetical protein